MSAVEMGSTSGRSKILIIVFVATALLCAAHMQFSRVWWRSEWPARWDEDITYIWFEGYHLKHGENPYRRIDGADLRYNNKFATYLPLFYYFAAVTEYPLPWFSDWMVFWRSVSFLCFAAIGVVLFVLLLRQGMTVWAMFALLFWCFNRWSISILDIAHTDFVAVLLLLLSVLTLPRRRRMSLVLLGLSLGVKHIAIVLTPLYLIWIAQQTPRGRRVRELTKASSWMALVPVVISIPFLILTPVDFLRSMLFSATRVGDGHFGAPSVDVYVWSIGLSGKLFMTFLFSLLYVAAYLRKLPPLTAVFLLLLVFADFNSVAFRQYMVWPIPFMLLAPLDLAALRPPTREDRIAENLQPLAYSAT